MTKNYKIKTISSDETKLVKISKAFESDFLWD